MSSLRPRLIPCLQVADGELLKTRRFKDPVYLGDPINAVKLFNDLDCDELIVVDIRATLGGRAPDYALIEEFASEAFMPLTYGGGISSVEHIRRILRIGIEKVVVGTAAATDAKLIAAAADTFGSQSIVVSVDVRKTILGRREVWIRSGTQNTGMEPRAFALRMQEQGAGELFVQSIDREGARSGYDLTLMKEVSQAVSIPVIGCGGAGTLDDVRRLMSSSRVAAAAGTMFVMHGKHGAPLISYPRAAEIASLLDTHEGSTR
jgi:cyclase